MKNLLQLIVVLFFIAGCSSKKDDVGPAATAELAGTWEATRASAYATPKGGKRQGATQTSKFTIELTADGKIKGIPSLDEDNFYIFDNVKENFDYVYEVKDDQFIISLPLNATSSIDRVYYKLSRSGNTMTWTMDLDLARKSIRESQVSITIPFSDEEDLDLLSDLEIKYELTKK